MSIIVAVEKGEDSNISEMNSDMLIVREKDYRARIAEYREKLLSSEVKKFINECDTVTGNSLLHQSTMKKYYSFIPYLVKEGAQVNIKNKKGYTGKTPRILSSLW